MKNELYVNGIDVKYKKINKDDYISLTDLARYANSSEPKVPIATWMRNKDVISYLGLWEKLHNPDFKGHEFESFENAAGRHSFYLSPQKWIESTNAIGIVSKSGNNGGTFAHRDIAFEFASWLSPEFKLYLVTEFQRLKAQEQKTIEWSAKRELAKVNYRIHTDAIKENIEPSLKNRVNYIENSFDFSKKKNLYNEKSELKTAKRRKHQKKPKILNDTYISYKYPYTFEFVKRKLNI